MTNPEFPVETFGEAWEHLRRPFTAGAVKWKVQQQAGNPPNKGMIVGYIDARLVMERLNLVVRDKWHDEYERLDGKHLLCRLTVCGITRTDVGLGPEAASKDAYSDALKRAAVKFGVGVSLYALRQTWIAVGEGQDKLKRVSRGNKHSLQIPPSTEEYLRGVYSMWLDTDRGKLFGEPLDHGDEEGSVGELAEAEQAAAAEAESDAFDAPRAEEQKAEIAGLYEALQSKNGTSKLKKGALNAMVKGAEHSNEELDKVLKHVRELVEAA
jgi:hypothetical protein